MKKLLFALLTISVILFSGCKDNNGKKTTYKVFVKSESERRLIIDSLGLSEENVNNYINGQIIKKDCCKTLAIDCVIEDFMLAWGSYILTDEGYEILKERYINEFNQFMEEERLSHEEDIKNEQLQCFDKQS